MDLYQQLNLKPVRSQPDVWISRLVILSNNTPDPLKIRDISLTRGLNIILAENIEDTNPTTEITGHSAGKTTFCRLLRYILGENTFGTKTGMELIQRSFPNGCVAAELHVQGQKWAVRRPFGGGRTYIKQDATIEELLKERGHPVSQDSYIREIGLESLLNELETGGIVRTGETIQWKHILSWCTRDQEARFQSLHEWRSPRSESDTPAFRFPKAGPLFVMRTVLGLFLPDELKGEERLAKLLREKEQLDKEIDEKKREPQFRVNLYDYQLRHLLKKIAPDESDIETRPFRSDGLFPEDLERLTTRIQEQIESDMAELEQECDSLQSTIDELGGKVQHLEIDLSELETLFNLNKASAVELDDGLSQRQKQRQDLQKHKDGLCPFGGILVSDCDHVINRQSSLSMSEFQDAKAMKVAEAVYVEESRKIEEQRASLQTNIDQLKDRRQTLQANRRNLITRIMRIQETLHDLLRTKDELIQWMGKQSRSDEFNEISDLHSKLNVTETEIAKIEEELAKMLLHHNQNRDLLATILSKIVRAVISSDNYDGEVVLDNRELSFRITYGPTMTGEAVETLSILLADLSCLVYNSVSDTAHLPGFLLHDSPREADLELRIYHSYMRFAVNLQEHFGSPEKCPFQYIITTTTPPPQELNTDSFVKLRLNAARESELLFRKNIRPSRMKTESLWDMSI